MAAAWQMWQEPFRVQTAAATAALVEQCGVREGMRVLDLASGIGEPALALGRAVGPRGEVVATDLVQEALLLLETRAREAGLNNIVVRQTDMEALPFADESFDVVTSRLGIMFSPNAERALSEARRVLRPGGTAAFLVWGSPDQPLFTNTFGVLATQRRLVWPPPLGMPGPFRFAHPGSITASLHSAGWGDVNEAQRVLPWPWPGPAEEAWNAYRDLSGTMLREVEASMAKDEWALVEAQIVASLRRYERDGKVDTTALVIIAEARR